MSKYFALDSEAMIILSEGIKQELVVVFKV
jgi:hypothetical protein